MEIADTNNNVESPTIVVSVNNIDKYPLPIITF